MVVSLVGLVREGKCKSCRNIGVSENRSDFGVNPILKSRSCRNIGVSGNRSTFGVISLGKQQSWPKSRGFWIEIRFWTDLLAKRAFLFKIRGK